MNSSEVIGVHSDMAIQSGVDMVPAISAEAEKNYRIWKKNAPLLYSYLSTTSLLWPSLTVQWFPDYEINPLNARVRKQRMALGTYTGGQMDDYLQLGNIHIINNSTVSGSTSEPLLSLEDWENNYDGDKEEFIVTKPLGNSNGATAKNSQSLLQSAKKLRLDIIQKIKTECEINKLRFMPQNPDVIATINNRGVVSVYDRTKHKSTAATLASSISPDTFQGFSSLGDEDRPVITLDAHNFQDGWGLSWNVQNEGQLLSGAMDGNVRLWDIKRSYKSQKSSGPISFPPAQSFTINEAKGVNDVKWFALHDSLFVTAGEDGYLTLIDIRVPQSSAMNRNQPHHFVGINSVSVSPLNNFVVASGDASGIVSIWDTRNWKQDPAQATPYKTWKGHSESITNVSWNPTLGHVLASSSQDKTVKIWDVGLDEIREPLFIHGGHMLGVNDFDWNANDEWMIGSVGDDNSLHVWRASDEIIKGYL